MLVKKYGELLREQRASAQLVICNTWKMENCKTRNTLLENKYIVLTKLSNYLITVLTVT